MSEQLLRNPDIEPSLEIIAEGLCEANAAYLDFLKELKGHCIDLEWRYYNDGSSWLGKGLYKWTGARGGQNEVTAFWLSIWEGFFKVTVYIPEKSRQDALCLPLSESGKELLENAKQIGKLKFFPMIFDLNSHDLFTDVFTLIDFRKQIK